MYCNPTDFARGKNSCVLPSPNFFSIIEMFAESCRKPQLTAGFPAAPVPDGFRIKYGTELMEYGVK